MGLPVRTAEKRPGVVPGGVHVWQSHWSERLGGVPGFSRNGRRPIRRNIRGAERELDIHPKGPF